MRVAATWVMVLAAAGSADWKDDDPASLLKKTGLTLSEAIAKAARQAGDAQAVGAELEEEDGKVIYSIEFAQGTKILEINLDAKSGDIVKKETEDEDKSAVAKACKVALAKAIETALQKVPGLAFVAEAGLEEGRAEIEVQILSEGKIQKVAIDGTTGAVLRVRSKKTEKDEKK